MEKVFFKISKIHRKTLVSEPLFYKNLSFATAVCCFIKIDSNPDVFQLVFGISEENSFHRTPPVDCFR